MSTKIWTAYRLKPGYDIWEVANKIRTKSLARATKTIAKTYFALLDLWANDKEAKEEALKVLGSYSASKEKLSPFDAHAYVYKSYREQKIKYEKDLFDLDVSVAIRKSGRRFYLIPYPGSGILSRTLDFMKNMSELEDYHYQNQSDRPGHISSREWLARKKAWEPMLEDWGNMLVLEIVCINNFSDIDSSWRPEEYKKLTKDLKPQSLYEVMRATP